MSDDEDYWNCACLLMQSIGSNTLDGDNRVRRLRKNFRRRLMRAFTASEDGNNPDFEIATFNPARTLHGFGECTHVSLEHRIGYGDRHQHTNTRSPILCR
jgi:hypothetical protein